MKIQGIIKGKSVIAEEQLYKSYPISKDQNKQEFKEGQLVEGRIDTEYPEDCDNNPFCEGDETCIQCLMNNEVFKIYRRLP